MNNVWISALGLSFTSIIGSLIGFCFKSISHRWNDIIMGFCAGIMLAASTVGLIVPASEMAGRELWWTILIGVILGMLFLNVLDKITPHLHAMTGLEVEEHKNNAHLNKTLLFVLAVTLHKLPEGIAAGVGFNADDTVQAWTVALGIAFQNIPEGMVIVIPLLLTGISRIRVFVISLNIAFLEIIGVWIGYAAGLVSNIMLPMMLAFAGGAMLYVVSDEMIPETHTHGYQKQATYALVLGFLTFVFMDKFF